MKIAILADIHSNYDALNAVINDCHEKLVDDYYFLGDLINRGPDLIKCVNWLMENVRKENSIYGNHEEFLFEWMPQDIVKRFNPEVFKTLNLHKEKLINEGLFEKFQDYFSKNTNIIEAKDCEKFNVFITHAGFVDPNGHERYVYPWYEMLVNSEFREGNEISPNKNFILFYGHTHVPTIISQDVESYEVIKPKKLIPGEVYQLTTSNNYLINPGSIGQPRDKNRDSSYMIFDTQDLTIHYNRIPYDYSQTIQKLAIEKYPNNLIKHLMNATINKDAPDIWK